MEPKHIFVIIITALVCACAPFSKEVMQKVDTTAAFGDIQKAPEKFVPGIVLWGGVIVETSNRAGETVIKVMQTELDFEKRPKDLDKSQGRFLVRYPGFLDPLIYEKNREITVTGQIAGKEVLPLGDSQYVYPVIKAHEIRLWKQREIYRDLYDPYWRHHPYWWDRYPYWGHRHPYW
jgi:outer membrane lipoprotein